MKSDIRVLIADDQEIAARARENGAAAAAPRGPVG